MSLRAILCIAALLASTSAAQAQSWSAEVYGGTVFDRSEDYDGISFDLDSGTAFGAGIYNTSWLGGVELGLDLMSTRADYTGFTSGVNTLSLMAVARVPFALSGATEAYVGAGLGTIRVEYDGGSSFPAFTGDDTVAGGQLSLGIRYAFAAQSGVFAELKHQRAFDDAEIVAGGVTIPQSYSSTSLLVGVSFDF